MAAITHCRGRSCELQVYEAVANQPPEARDINIRNLETWRVLNISVPSLEVTNSQRKANGGQTSLSMLSPLRACERRYRDSVVARV